MEQGAAEHLRQDLPQGFRVDLLSGAIGAVQDVVEALAGDSRQPGDHR